jgi:hypothetical protein
VGRLGAAITSALAIGVGLVTLIGLLAGANAPIIATVTSALLQIVVITAALAILIGILNLFSVHIGRIIGRGRGWFYSIILLVSAFAVIMLTLLERAGTLTTQPALTTGLLENVQVPIESALAALVLFALVYGAARMLRRRVTWTGVLFIAVLLILLVGALPLPGAGAVLAVRDWLLAVPVSAGARGILLGIALATVVTGVRVLIGQDRSYRE